MSIFKKPVAITATLIEHATTLEAFKPEPGEIAACRKWMYQTDTKRWYSQHGMELGHVVKNFERFRSLADVPDIRVLPAPCVPPPAPSYQGSNKLPVPPRAFVMGGAR